MSLYRDRTTGDLKDMAQLKSENRNVSLPKVWNEDVYDTLNVDPVLSGTTPTVTEMQTYQLTGATQNSDGDWVEEYAIVDMFSDDENSTKAQKEAAYQAQLDDNAALINRGIRNDKLQETDWWAVSDRTMASEQTAYRTALRNLPTHSNWPYLNVDDWPTKP